MFMNCGILWNIAEYCGLVEREHRCRTNIRLAMGFGQTHPKSGDVTMVFRSEM